MHRCPECGATKTKDGRPFTEKGLAAHRLSKHKVAPNPTPLPPPPKPEVTIPKVLHIELTPKAYQTLKENLLSRQRVRTHIETYFEWLRSIRPEDVVDFIETGKTLKEAYEQAPYRWRLAIAMGRAMLKSVPKYAQQLTNIIKDLNFTLTTLKFENPTTYKIIQQYGKRGIQFIQQCQESALEIFNLKKKETPKTD